MDSRDITTHPPKYYSEVPLIYQLFHLHEELILEYQKIERLPEFPLFINSKESQVIIKDFIGRIIEELAEGAESLNFYIDQMDFMDYHKYSSETFSYELDNIQNFNEELSDALHFYLETLIAVGLNKREYFDRYLPFKGSLVTSAHLTIPIHKVNNINTLFDNKVYANTSCYSDIEHIIGSKMDKEEAYMYRGYHLGVYHLNSIKTILWDITYYLNLARNCLKNKPWKQSEVETDLNIFYNNLMLGFKHLIWLFQVVGHDDESLYVIYWKKHEVNKFRIQSKY